MKKHLLLLSLAFLLIAVSLSAPAQAATQPANLQFMSPIAPGATVMKYKGEAATAFFSQTSDGCLYTDTYLFAGAGKLQNPPGAPEANNWANVSVYRYDSCTGTWLTGASGSVAINNATFQIDQQLNAAHLQTTVPMYDWMTGASFNLAVDLTWAGNGDLTRSKSQNQYQSPGCKFKSQFNGSFRSAVASGTISDGATNYAIGAYQFADLQSVKSGNVTIGCGW